MNKFEKQRQKLEREYENELEELNRNRSSMESSDYWSSYGELATKYKQLLDDVDSQQRAHAALSAAKDAPKQPQRPEATYADVVGQLKATKMSELIAELASIPTQAIEDVDINDPFYLDKKEPLTVFERWWTDEMNELPSVSEVQEFLSRIHINKNGYITYDVDADTTFMDDTEEVLLKSIPIKTAAARRREKKANEVRRVKSRMPLLANKDPKKYIREVKKLNNNPYSDRLSAFIGVIDSYDLPVDLSDLLYTHAEKVCIPKGLLRIEQYQPMLEQFLRFVTDPQERLFVVKQAIERNWRMLSNGTF